MKYFLEKWGSSQNSRPVKIVMERFGAVQFDVLPRSPGCNPIKNVFRLKHHTGTL